MNARDYDPAVRIHAAGCPAAPPSLLVVPGRSIAERYPNGRPHPLCVSSASQARGALVVETVDYPPHSYVASTIKPDDATRALCRTCRGTHGGDPLTTALGSW